MMTKAPSSFKDPVGLRDLAAIHEIFVVVTSDKASNNILFVCIKHYLACLIKELDFKDMSGSPTYTPTTLS